MNKIWKQQKQKSAIIPKISWKHKNKNRNSPDVKEVNKAWRKKLAIYQGYQQRMKTELTICQGYQQSMKTETNPVARHLRYRIPLVISFKLDLVVTQLVTLRQAAFPGKETHIKYETKPAPEHALLDFCSSHFWPQAVEQGQSFAAGRFNQWLTENGLSSNMLTAGKCWVQA